MSEDQCKLIDEAIKLEMNMAELYISFHNNFPEDSAFWWKIATEEEDHAALLKNEKQHFLDTGKFASKLVGESLEALVELNSSMEGILRREMESPSLERNLAFKLAIRLEESAGEVHLQHAIQQPESPSEAIKLFQRLNEADMNHATRIRNYMRMNGME